MTSPLPAPAPLRTRFDACRAFTMAQEGGYSADRMDTGNWLGHLFVGSCYGVTPAALMRCYGQEHGLQVTAAYMRHLPDQATAATYLSYWSEMGCEGLTPGVDLMVFDFGFNAGTRTSVKRLQECLGFPVSGDPRTAVDGMCGAGTVARAGQTEPRGLVHDLFDAQCLHYSGLAQFPRYGGGWLARAARRRDASLARIVP